MSGIALLLAIAAPANPALATGVTGVDVSEREIRIRFDDVVETASSFVLAGPDRIALDIDGAQPGAEARAGGLVERIRQGQPDANRTRIVFDLASPAIIDAGRFSADGRELTLSLSAVEPERFDRAAKDVRKRFLPPPAHRAAPPRSRYSITVPLAPAKKGLPTPRIYGPAGRPLVVIDAGHGGHDPGAISPHTGQREKDATLAIARAIRDELIAGGRVRVALTREDDRFLVLRERSTIAKAIGASLFISVHADSAGAAGAHGATIYTLSEVASDREAAALAGRENKADIINGVNLGHESSEISSILVDLAQRDTMNASASFAGLLHREAGRDVPFRSDFHRMAGFEVLKQPDMPAILLEVGYLTNVDDVARLFSPGGRKQIATGIRKAVDIHFARRFAQR